MSVPLGTGGLMATSTLVRRQLEALRRHPNDPRQHVDWVLLAATARPGRRGPGRHLQRRATRRARSPASTRTCSSSARRLALGVGLVGHGRRARSSTTGAGATSPSGSTSAPARCSARCSSSGGPTTAPWPGSTSAGSSSSRPSSPRSRCPDARRATSAPARRAEALPFNRFVVALLHRRRPGRPDARPARPRARRR